MFLTTSQGNGHGRKVSIYSSPNNPFFNALINDTEEKNVIHTEKIKIILTLDFEGNTVRVYKDIYNEFKMCIMGSIVLCSYQSILGTFIDIRLF